MKKLFAVVMILVLSAVSYAGSNYGVVKLSNTGLAEGPYKVTTVTSLSNVKVQLDHNNLFTTFCVEGIGANEYFWPGKMMYSTIDDNVLYDPDADGVKALDVRVKKIYAAYLNGALDSLGPDYEPEVQRAVWQAQGVKTIYGADLASVMYLVESDSSNYAGYERVKVLNLWAPENSHVDINKGADYYTYKIGQYDRQSQLVMVVPAPGAILLAGAGTAMVGFMRRRSL